MSSSRLIFLLLMTLLPAGAAQAVMIDPGELRRPGVSVRFDHAQLGPFGSVQISTLGPQWSWAHDGTWTVGVSRPQWVSVISSGLHGGLPDMDMEFDFTPIRSRSPDGLHELIVRLQPSQMRAVAVSRFTAPPNAQITTALGLDELVITAGGVEVSSVSSRVIAKQGGMLSEQTLVPFGPWATAPVEGDGSWTLSMFQSLIGSYHLLASTDPLCESLSCMPGRRADAHLLRLDLAIPADYEVIAVPEPTSLSLFALGLLALPWLRTRRAR